MINKVVNWLTIIQDCLLPPTCILCGNAGFAGRDLCQFCYSQLPRNQHYCPQCAGALADNVSTDSVCGECIKTKRAFDKTYAPYLHADALRRLILDLKFASDYKNARLLGALLAESMQQVMLEKPDCLIPVPLHKSRYRQRGFNQSIEIARTVAKQLEIPLELTLCQRHRKTEQQTKLTAKQRHSNVKNAFVVTRPVTVQHVALLDDVMTTGATVQELARVLKQAGVQRVDVWVCARAGR